MSLCRLYLSSLNSIENTLYDDADDARARLPKSSESATRLRGTRRLSLNNQEHISSLASNNERNPWEEFYSVHKHKFFKDRHYLGFEHVHLATALKEPNRTIRILDFGSGVGNAILPLLDGSNASVEYLGLDISATAVNILKDELTRRHSQKHVFVVCSLDLVNCTDEDFNSKVEEFYRLTNSKEEFDFCLMIFTISAFPPNKMLKSVSRACRCLKKGTGRICFRDYMQSDMAQLRFAPGQKIGRNLYQRQDRTLSFFFSQTGLISLFEDPSLDTRVSWIKPIKKIVENKADGLKMFRSWLGAEIVRSM